MKKIIFSTLFLFLLLLNQCKSKQFKKEYYIMSYYSSGKLKDSFSYKDTNGLSLKNGFCFEFYENGYIENWHNYKYGILYSKQLEYYPSGNLHRFYYIKDSMYYDNYYEFHDHKKGCIKLLDTFVNGIKYGQSTIYDTIGKIIIKGANKSTDFYYGGCICEN